MYLTSYYENKIIHSWYLEHYLAYSRFSVNISCYYYFCYYCHHLFDCPWKPMSSWVAQPPVYAPTHRELINPLRQQLQWQLGMCTNHVVFSRPVISHTIMAPRRAQYSVWCSWGTPTGVSGGMKDGIFTRAFQRRENKWPHSIPSDSACASVTHHVAILCLECLTVEVWTID